MSDERKPQSAREFYNDGWKPNPRRNYGSEMEYWLDFAEAYAASQQRAWVNPHVSEEAAMARGDKP
jgi:hypothetical protein